MPLLPRTLPAGFIAPCLPSSAPQAPSGEEWLHEIKHDGFRIIARKNGERVRLYSRPGNDLTDRFPLIVEALAKLGSQSCIIDGEAVACGDDGISSFDRIRCRHHDASVFLYAFDLIELDGGGKVSCNVLEGFVCHQIHGFDPEPDSCTAANGILTRSPRRRGVKNFKCL
jgi:ATP-dependent DNA ligase